MKTQERVINMVSLIANIPLTQICLTTSLKDDLELDSIDLMLLIVKIEKWFDVEFSNVEVERIDTVKDASDCINRYLTPSAVS